MAIFRPTQGGLSASGMLDRQRPTTDAMPSGRKKITFLLDLRRRSSIPGAAFNGSRGWFATICGTRPRDARGGRTRHHAAHKPVRNTAAPIAGGIAGPAPPPPLEALPALPAPPPATTNMSAVTNCDGVREKLPVDVNA